MVGVARTSAPRRSAAEVAVTGSVGTMAIPAAR